jgi:hypothetical protein
MELKQFFEQFIDHLAPKLDTYEQALYLYIFRRSRLDGSSEVTIGFKSARKQMAFGIGEKGKPMSEGTCYEKLRSLQGKGCLELLGTERDGTRIRLHLPSEINGLIPLTPEFSACDIETMDYFEDEENRALILDRERHQCFYCARKLTSANYVIEHVMSRPLGSNSYRNVVAACVDCNNRKNDQNAEGFLRSLYRDRHLSGEELQKRLQALDDLQAGRLKPLRRD